MGRHQLNGGRLKDAIELLCAHEDIDAEQATAIL
jgi:hypothetical protein